MKFQREQLDSILKNQIFKLDQSLENLFDEFNQLETYDSNHQFFVNQIHERIHERLNILERKVIDNYINDK